VQQRPTDATMVDDPGGSEMRILAEVALQRLDVATLNRRPERHSSRIIGLDIQHPLTCRG
jgi:hypothetical protein